MRFIGWLIAHLRKVACDTGHVVRTREPSEMGTHDTPAAKSTFWMRCNVSVWQVTSKDKSEGRGAGVPRARDYNAGMKTWLRVTVLLVTIPGGVFGFVVTLRAILAGNIRGIAAVSLVVCVLLAFAFVTLAGILYWRDPKESTPLMWALAIQIPWVSLPGIVYKFVVGAYGFVGLVVTHNSENYSIGFSANGSLGSLFEIRILQNANIELGVNAVALALLLLLRRFGRGASAPNESVTADAPHLS